MNTPEWVDFSKEPEPYWEMLGGVKTYCFPSIKHFEPGKMRSSDRKKLESWHRLQIEEFKKNPANRYYVQTELVDYCK